MIRNYTRIEIYGPYQIRTNLYNPRRAGREVPKARPLGRYGLAPEQS